VYALTAHADSVNWLTTVSRAATMACSTSAALLVQAKTVEPWLLHDFEQDFYGEELRLVVSFSNGTRFGRRKPAMHDAHAALRFTKMLRLYM
jgi:hypothetical protein